MKDNTKEPRIIVRIELRPEAKEALTKESDFRGMTQLSICSRVLEWFARQDESTRGAILGLYPKELESEIAGMILKHMTSKKK